MATDISALSAAIKLVVDAVKDGIASGKDSTALGKLIEFQNLIPDIEALLPKVGEIPAEVAALQPADYQALVLAIGADASQLDPALQPKINAVLNLLGVLANSVYPAVQGVLVAFAAPVAPAAPPAP